jgi:hypothetical protein
VDGRFLCSAPTSFCWYVSLSFTILWSVLYVSYHFIFILPDALLHSLYFDGVPDASFTAGKFLNSAFSLVSHFCSFVLMGGCSFLFLGYISCLHDFLFCISLECLFWKFPPSLGRPAWALPVFTWALGVHHWSGGCKYCWSHSRF